MRLSQSFLHATLLAILPSWSHTPFNFSWGHFLLITFTSALVWDLRLGTPTKTTAISELWNYALFSSLFICTF